MDKQDMSKLTGAGDKRMASRFGGAGGLGEKGEGVEKDRWAVSEQSWGCEVQLRECSQ